MFIAFGMTDENFTVASLYVGKLSFPFFAGLILTSFSGWVLGTLVGALRNSDFAVNCSGGAQHNDLRHVLRSAAARRQKKRSDSHCHSDFRRGFVPVLVHPVLAALPSGINIIVPTVLAAAIGAWLFPMKEQQSDDVKGENSDE